MILKQIIQYTNDLNSIEVTWVDEDDKPVRCHVFNGPDHSLLRSELGADAAQYESMIASAESHWVEPAPAPVPPIVVSPRQIRQALTQTGLRSGVEAAITSGNQDLKDWWEFATQFEENHPMVVQMATALSVTEVQLHDLFVLARSL